MRNNIKSVDGFGKDMSPPAIQVKVYLSQKGFEESEIDQILNTILSRGWKTQTGRPIKNWKQYLFQWQYILKNPLRKSKRKCTRTPKR